MSTTRIRRDIQVQYDTGPVPDTYEVLFDYEHGWLIDDQQAHDLVSSWSFNRHDRADAQARKVYALSTIGPDLRPLVAIWAPVPGTDGNYYSLDQFPFQAHIEVIGRRPERVTPDPTPDDAAFLAFGKAAASIMVSHTEWDSDTWDEVARAANTHIGRVDCDMPLSTYVMWEPIVKEQGEEMWEYAGDE